MKYYCGNEVMIGDIVYFIHSSKKPLRKVLSVDDYTMILLPLNEEDIVCGKFIEKSSHYNLVSRET